MFRLLLRQRHLTTHQAFSAQYERPAVRLSQLDGDSRLASLHVSARQFDRWYGGELRTLPRPDACRVLEHMLGRPASGLFSVANDDQAPCEHPTRSEESPTDRRQPQSLPSPRESDENPL
jgi:hypothetical protein